MAVAQCELEAQVKASDDRGKEPGGVRLLSGNQAIAQGAWEAGVRVACAYPGTPSTEIIETLARCTEVDCEWSTNEKVAVEVAAGAAVAGGRAIAAMKHVGLNVAADPFFSAAYMGANGGLVIVSADDPGMHSSQNEQDNRFYARAARVPMLEPATPQEAKELAAAAFDLSERYDTPVLLRITTRVAHAVGEVHAGPRRRVGPRKYVKDARKNIVLPANGRVHHAEIEGVRMPALAAEAERWVREVAGAEELAVITAGVAYLYVREALPEASVLKLAMTHPLPIEAIRGFVRGKKRVLVVEELEPFIEEQLRAAGIACEGKSLFPRCGELGVDCIRQAVHGSSPEPLGIELPSLPPRPPALCAGCPHRGTFYTLKQHRAIVAGDIGCYTLGALKPLDAMDTSMSMGAAVGMAHGMSKVLPEEDRARLVAVIGDSTFYHSGISGLVDLVYNGGDSTVVVLDNHTTAMTGHQEHPGSGRTIRGEETARVEVEKVCRGLGVENVHKVDPYDLRAVWQGLDEAMHEPGPSVVIADAPCVLLEKRRLGEAVRIDPELCTECQACTDLGCPALSITDGSLRVDPLLCNGCTLCQQVCSTCNAGIDVPQVLELVHQKRLDDALRVVLRANPLPAVTARVCPHPCEHEVNALGWPQARVFADRYPDLVSCFAASDDPRRLSACAVERFLGDYGLECGLDMPDRPAERGQRVAVIGSGPAGLSVAWQLRLGGAAVEIFERDDQPGGLLRYGIPPFRLPREVLAGEVDRIVRSGVRLSCGVEVGRDVTLEELACDFDAVVVAVGQSASRRLDLAGAGAVSSGLVDGLELLRSFSCGLRPAVGKRVTVVGGGNTAVDCARAARRFGAEVTVVYRRTEDEMPAIPSEVAEARAEGVRFELQSAPVRVVTDRGRVCELHVVRTQPGPADADGRRSPVAVPGSEHVLATDTVVGAIGQEVDPGFLGGSGAAEPEWSPPSFSGATTRSRVFACGDVAFGHGTVAQAIATGRRVARTVEAFLDAGRRH